MAAVEFKFRQYLHLQVDSFAILFHCQNPTLIQLDLILNLSEGGLASQCFPVAFLIRVQSVLKLISFCSVWVLSVSITKLSEVFFQALEK